MDGAGGGEGGIGSTQQVDIDKLKWIDYTLSLPWHLAGACLSGASPPKVVWQDQVTLR